MRFIHTWSYKCAHYLMHQQGENHERRRVYYYGIQIIIGAIVKGVLLVSIGLLLGILKPTLVAVLVFASLRVLAGGYHMHTYGKCIVASLALFIFAGLITQYTYQYWHTSHVIVFTALVFLLGLFVILKWAPADTPNKPITDPGEIRKFKILSTLHIIVWVCLSTVFIVLGHNMLVIAGSFGLILEVFTVSPIGHRFFGFISGESNK